MYSIHFTSIKLSLGHCCMNFLFAIFFLFFYKKGKSRKTDPLEKIQVKFFFFIFTIESSNKDYILIYSGKMTHTCPY